MPCRPEREPAAASERSAGPRPAAAAASRPGPGPGGLPHSKRHWSLRSIVVRPQRQSNKPLVGGVGGGGAAAAASGRAAAASRRAEGGGEVDRDSGSDSDGPVLEDIFLPEGSELLVGRPGLLGKVHAWIWNI